MYNKSNNLNNIEYKQYAQQIILENIGLNGQKRLKNANVLIIGLGGLGCPALLYLVASGIGHIGIMDYDKVSLSNLNRQILYNTNHINKNKTKYAKSSVQNINKECKITIYDEKLNHNNGYKIIKQYEIVIDATDNFKVRYIIDEICYQLHKIHIYGAINKYEGHLSVFNYKNNLRYIDIYPNNLNLQEISCTSNGILGAMSGIIGLLQITEALKIILGIGTIQSGYMLQYNLLNISFNHIKFNSIKNKNKPKIILNGISKINQIIGKKDLYKLEHSKFIIIDIRNRINFYNNHSNKAINIPAYKFQAKQTIEALKSSCNIYKIILSCNNITTALTIANLLKKYNIKALIFKLT